jgi:hypothetical protein
VTELLNCVGAEEFEIGRKSGATEADRKEFVVNQIHRRVREE